MLAFALLLQAAGSPPAPVTRAPVTRAPVTRGPVTRADAAPPANFSILTDPCARIVRDGRDVVVCGRDTATSQRLPYPEEMPPDHGVPSNPLTNGRGALAAEVTPCAALMRGCQVGVGPPLVPMIAALVNGMQNGAANRREARARARDGARRVPIDLNGQPPAGRLEP